MRWSQLILVKNKQALLLVHMLDGNKEKIDENVKDEDLVSKEGITKLLEFLNSIYEKDSLSGGYEKYMAFEKFRKFI